jgi:drug/metabolite transporter (DMT)-like permease
VEGLALVFAGLLAQGAGSVLQKHAVATRMPGLGLRDARLLRALARSRLWLLGFCAMLLGAACGLQALSMVDLSVLKAFGRFESLVVALAGAAFLGERLTRREWTGVLLLIAGGAALGATGARATGSVVSTASNLAYPAAGAALLAALALARRAWPHRLRPEIGLALAAGILMGAGDVLMKGATSLVRASTGDFRVLDGASLGALADTALLPTAIAAYTAGFVLVQVAYANGRVSVISPVVGVGATVPPIAFGLAVLSESADPARVLGMGLLLSGGWLLLPRSGPPRP